VQAIGVNEIFQLCGIERCDLLKMDCEGSELPILLALSPDAWQGSDPSLWNTMFHPEVDAILGILSHSGFSAKSWATSGHYTPAAINASAMPRCV